jgi:alanyl-tRNA synthetase
LTRRLYQEDSYRTDFEAGVIEVFPHGKHFALILDHTCFYPESGGQPPDTGQVGGAAIETVLEEAGRILHITARKPSFAPGDRVRGSIDWTRRLINMQQHTGQHVLSQAFLRVLDAQTVSSKLGVEHSTIDVAGSDLTWDDVKATEDLANRIVYEDRPVVIFDAGKDEVEGLRIKMPIDRERIRVVEVKDFDRSPCGGTHTKTTGEIGPIKILRWEKVRDTVRVEFICGILAMDDYFWKSRFVVELAQELTTKDRSLPMRIPEMLEEGRELSKEVAALRRDLARYRAGDLLAGATEMRGAHVISAYMEDGNPGEIREMAAALTDNPRTVALLASGKDRLHFVFSRSSDLEVDMRKVMQTACSVVGGKGGGKPAVCQGGGKDPTLAPEALKAAEAALEGLLAS